MLELNSATVQLANSSLKQAQLEGVHNSLCYLGAEKIVLTQECVYVVGHLSEWLN